MGSNSSCAWGEKSNGVMPQFSQNQPIHAATFRSKARERSTPVDEFDDYTPGAPLRSLESFVINPLGVKTLFIDDMSFEGAVGDAKGHVPHSPKNDQMQTHTRTA